MKNYYARFEEKQKSTLKTRDGRKITVWTNDEGDVRIVTKRKGMAGEPPIVENTTVMTKECFLAVSMMYNNFQGSL